MTDQKDKAIARLLALVEDGLRHGNFDIEVHCSIVQHNARRLIIAAGKSYKFEIPPEELQEAA